MDDSSQPPRWHSPDESAEGRPTPPAAPPAAPTGAQGWGTPPAAPTGAQGWGAPPAGQGWGPPGGVPLRPKPGIIPLRPLGLGEIYDGAFQAMRTNPRTLLGVSAVVVAVSTLITIVPQSFAAVALTRFSDTTENTPVAEEIDFTPLGQALGGFAFTYLIQTVALSILTGLLIVAIGEAVLGRATTPGQVWRKARGRLVALVVVTVLASIAYAVGFVLLIIPGVLLYVRWSMAAPAMMLEGQGVIEALRRSWTVTRGSFWRVFGILLLTTIMIGFAAGIVALPVGIIAGAVTAAGSADPGSQTLFLTQVAQQLVTAVAGVVLYPFQAAVTALLYIDLRMRREGLDVELIRAAGEGAAG